MNSFLTTYGFFAVNTLNKTIYPVRGFRLEGEFGWVYNQDPSVKFYDTGHLVTNPDSLGISYNNYQHLIFNGDAYAPLSNKLTFISSLQAGINFNYRQSILNDFNIGGLNKTIRNQVLFAGLEENNFNTPSVATALVGLRYELYNNVYIMGKAKWLVNNSSVKIIYFRNQIFFPGMQ